MTRIQKCFIALFLVGIFFSPMSSAENLSQQNDKISLYHYGGVNESKDNLENLFHNFPVYVENGKDIDFIAYQFIGTIKNEREAEKYVKKNFNDLPPIGWSTSIEVSSVGEVSTTESSTMRLHSTPIRESKAELKRMANTISKEYVKPGYEVYAIDFVLNLQKHTHYVFIDPESKQVLLKGNIFGIEIPLSHFESRKNEP